MENKQKEELYNILKDPNDKLIAVDLDGTLCEGVFWGDGDPRPLIHRIKYFNKLYKRGAHIIIYTARQPKWLPETQSWLDKHEVMYHGIMMQKKPGADLYIDDLALNINDLDIKE